MIPARARLRAGRRRPCISERAWRGVSSCNDVLPVGVLSLMKIEPKIAAASAELTAIRRDIHAHPELGFEEERTSEIVARSSRNGAARSPTGIGKTGVVGTIRVGNNPRAIGLRADMDALPMDEHNTFDHRSQHKGRMHACGHDGHTTMLLGAAKLSRDDAQLRRHRPSHLPAGRGGPRRRRGDGQGRAVREVPVRADLRHAQPAQARCRQVRHPLRPADGGRRPVRHQRSPARARTARGRKPASIR